MFRSICLVEVILTTLGELTKTNERINVPTDKQLYNYLQHRLTTVLSIITSQKRLASPVESVNKRNRMTENVDEILEEQDGTRQTRSEANNLIKSTAQSSSHSATQEVKRQRGSPKKTAILLFHYLLNFYFVYKFLYYFTLFKI
ncbi:hypothetical protein BpHYR1_027149 [Brachionus plicatilis]|uniref:Uncharacterized protein n=1 Tax=Brachionus plicatilis TaxID=10195 RepID=A0A3M7QF51_BRAPC|nr:hypothetical protein BpHYR1_027149 [Brachionus plicatilis]